MSASALLSLLAQSGHPAQRKAAKRLLAGHDKAHAKMQKKRDRAAKISQAKE